MAQPQRFNNGDPNVGRYQGLDQQQYKRPGIGQAHGGYYEQLNNYTPDQLQYQNMARERAQMSMQGLNLPGSQQNSFEPQAQLAYNNFHQKGIPLLAERFAGMGGNSGASLSSPDLYRNLSAGQSDVEAQIAALRSQYNLQNSAQQSGNYFNLSNQGNQQQFSNSYTPPVEQEPELPWWKSLLKSAIPALGGAAATAFGGPAAGQAVYNAGRAVGDSFSPPSGGVGGRYNKALNGVQSR